MSDTPTVWVFNGERASFPSAVFTTKDLAEAWISRHQLNGTLTRYPLNYGVYEWAIERGYFAPRREDQRSPEFIGRFSATNQEHYHYEGGDNS